MSESGSSTVVLEPKQTKSKRVDELLKEKADKDKLEQELEKKQNDFFFDTLHIISVRSGDPSKVQKTAKKINKAALKGHEKSQKQKHEQDLQAAKWQPRYEDRLNRVKEAMQELEGYKPISTLWIGIYDKLVKDGEAAVYADAVKKTPKPNAPFEAEYKKLPPRGDIEKTIKEATEAYNGAKSKAGKEATLSTPQYEKMLKDLKAAPMGVAQKELWEEKITAVYNKVLATDGDATKRDADVLKELQGVATELNKDIGVCVQAKQKYETTLPSLTKLDNIVAIGPGLAEGITDARIAELQRLRENAVTAAALGEYVLAAETLDTLVTDLADLPELDRKMQELRERWQDNENGVEFALDEVDSLVGTINQIGEAAKPLLVESGMIKTALTQLQKIKTTADAATLQTALATFEQLEERLSALHDRVFEAGDFQDKKAGLIAPVDKSMKELKDALAGMPKKLDDAQITFKGLRDSLLNPLMADYRPLAETWENRKKNAFDSVSLGADDIAKQIEALKKRVTATVEPTNLQAVAGNNAMADARGKFAKQLEEANKAASLTMSRDPLRGLAFQDSVNKLNSAASSETDAGKLAALTDKLAKMITSQKKNIEQADKEIKQRQAEIDGLINGLDQKIEGIKKTIEKSSDNDKRKSYGALYATLKSDLEAVMILRQSDQIGVLTQGVADATSLKENVENTDLAAQDAVRGVFSRKKLKNGIPTLETLSLDLKKMVEKLKGDTTAQTYLTQSHATLTEKVDTMLSDLGKTSITTADKQKAGLQGEIEELAKKAKDAKAKYEEKGGIKDIGKEITELLKNDAFKTAPDYVKSARSQMEACLSNGQFEGGLDAALKDMTKLALDLGEMVRSKANAVGVPVRIAEAQEKSKADVDKKEVDAKAWESELHILDKDLKAVKSVNKKEIGALQDRLETAKKDAEKSGDYSTGRQVLAELRQRLVLVEGNPKGLKITARNNLPKVNQAFEKAVMEFAASLVKLGDEIGKTDLDDEGKGKINHELAELRVMFNPSAFKKTVEVMANKSNTEEKRSAEREVGLREMRRLNALLEKDYRLRELANTPFKVNTPTVLSKLKLTLLDLENNMLVSM
jgi:hypothetical protein